VFGHDSHRLFGSFSGLPIWLPVYARFFASLGLNFDERYSLRGNGPGVDVEDIDSIPLQTPAIRDIYARFLVEDPRLHRAFAFSADGHAGYARGEHAEDKARAACARHSRLECTLYAVDQQVVYAFSTQTGKLP
jgi:hypothetical protein